MAACNDYGQHLQQFVQHLRLALAVALIRDCPMIFNSSYDYAIYLNTLVSGELRVGYEDVFASFAKFVLDFDQSAIARLEIQNRDPLQESSEFLDGLLYKLKLGTCFEDFKVDHLDQAMQFLLLGWGWHGMTRK